MTWGPVVNVYRQNEMALVRFELPVSVAMERTWTFVKAILADVYRNVNDDNRLTLVQPVVVSVTPEPYPHKCWVESSQRLGAL